MSDIFENVPAPTDDELRDFERLAREAPPIDPIEDWSTLHNQYRLVVPRLAKEIRRLRELVKLHGERDQLRDEKQARVRAATDRNFDGYGEGVERLFCAMNDKRKRNGGGQIH